MVVRMSQVNSELIGDLLTCKWRYELNRVLVVVQQLGQRSFNHAVDDEVAEEVESVVDNNQAVIDGLIEQKGSPWVWVVDRRVAPVQVHGPHSRLQVAVGQC